MTAGVGEFSAANPQVNLHFTPTHASWLNQVELFFSILERRLLRHGEFDSVDQLAARIIAFINDYNRRAKPFRWTYDGRPLMARIRHNDLRARPLGGGCRRRAGDQRVARARTRRRRVRRSAGGSSAGSWYTS